MILYERGSALQVHAIDEVIRVMRERRLPAPAAAAHRGARPARQHAQDRRQHEQACTHTHTRQWPRHTAPAPSGRARDQPALT